MQYERGVAAHNDTVVIIERKFNIEESRKILLYASVVLQISVVGPAT